MIIILPIPHTTQKITFLAENRKKTKYTLSSVGTLTDAEQETPGAEKISHFAKPVKNRLTPDCCKVTTQTASVKQIGLTV